MDLWTTLAPFMKKLPTKLNMAVCFVVVMLVLSSVFSGFPLDLRSWLDMSHPPNKNKSEQNVSQTAQPASQSPNKSTDDKPTINIEHSQGVIIGDSNNVKMEFHN